jgi:hypothetical protein
VNQQIIEEIRALNFGRLILGHPQDAFLAASILKFSQRYLWSGKPFGWVGTSSKSAGLAITHKFLGAAQADLSASYAQSVSQSSSLPYSSKLDFRHGVNARYLFDALSIVWPDFIDRRVGSSSWFQFRLDVNLISNSNRKNLGDFTIDQLVSCPRFVLLKLLLGLALMFWRKSLALGLSLLATIAKPILQNRYHYISIQRESSMDALYEASSNLGS